LIKNIYTLFDYKKKRFLIVGFINTIFAYISAILIFNSLYYKIGIVFYCIFLNLVNICFSFISYKFFVFKNKNKIHREIFKAIVSYSIIITINMSIIFLLIEIIKLNIYASQVIVLGCIVPIAYFLHNNYTYKD
jgi:putative flippase GtrA